MKTSDNVKRRKAIKQMVSGAVGYAAISGSSIFACSSPSPEESNQHSENVGMYVGCQHGGTGKSNLEFLARHGVYHMDGGAPNLIEGVGWDLKDSLKKKADCEAYGVHLDAYHMPLSSAGIERVAMPSIMLARSPERDKEIEILKQMIQVAGDSGVNLLLYNTTILPILRTGRTTDPTRGNAKYSTWKYDEAIKENPDLIIGEEVAIDEIYDRIRYLLDAILPVAEKHQVKLGNHIADPPTTPGYRGITRWNSPDVFEGIKRFAQLYDSPYHGFNLCLGSTAEGLKNPEREIYPIIRWLGEREQIFNIHLRNIKGGWNDFMEVYPDNGDLDFFEIIKTLKAVNYQGMIMPDHIPRHDDPASGLQGHAFAFGYIKALIHAANA